MSTQTQTTQNIRLHFYAYILMTNQLILARWLCKIFRFLNVSFYGSFISKRNFNFTIFLQLPDIWSGQYSSKK